MGRWNEGNAGYTGQEGSVRSCYGAMYGQTEDERIWENEPHEEKWLVTYIPNIRLTPPHLTEP
jgi:hypothetical protein